MLRTKKPLLRKKSLIASALAGLMLATGAGMAGASELTEFAEFAEFDAPSGAYTPTATATPSDDDDDLLFNVVTTIAAHAKKRADFDGNAALDAAWKCGKETGPRWEQWKKSVLLFAVTHGYGFRAVCNRTIIGMQEDYQPIYGTEARPDTALIIFRDQNEVPQYAGWYDSKFDKANSTVYGGVLPLTAEVRYDIRQTPYQNYPLHGYTQEQMDEYYAAARHRSDKTRYDYDYLVDITYTDDFYRSITRRQGCKRPYWSCGTGGLIFEIPGGEATINLDVFPETPDMYAFGSIFEQRIREDKWYDKLFIVAANSGWMLMGGAIGLQFGLVAGSAGHVAFSAGFGSFGNSLFNGQSVEDAFKNGLKGAAFAYVGTKLIDNFGDRTSRVGVSGIGCPTGDQCWYFDMLNSFPPVKHLAELHDPFIDWSIDAFKGAANNGWYKAVTIAPFVVPGCLASDACVVSAIAIVNENEVK